MPRDDGSRRPRRSLGSKRRLESGRWQIRVSCGYTRDGKQRRVTETVDTEAQADRRIRELAWELGRDGSMGETMTLDTYFRRLFVPRREGVLANSTLRRYEGDYERLIAPLFGRRRLTDIPHREVQARVLELPRSKAEHFVTTLRVILRSAWDDGYLTEEPMRHRLRMPKDDRQQLGVWSADEVARALPAMEGAPVEALWLLMVGGGLRREEAYALFWADLDFEGDCVLCAIDDAVTVEDGRKEVKTRFSERVAVVCEPFASRLAELAGEPSEPVCSLALTSVPRCWRKLWQEPPAKACPASFRGRMLEAGVPYLPLSRMRATHETLMQQAGVGDALNSRIHGRASGSQVGYRHYLNPQLQAFQAAGEAVGGLLADAGRSAPDARVAVPKRA